MTERMTDEAIREAVERADAATPGPWTREEDSEVSYVYSVSSNAFGRVCICSDLTYYPQAVGVEDQDFIAHARTDVPALAAECLARGEELAALKAQHAAAVAAWEEYARWPDLPSVPIGRVRWPDGREEEVALRPEQVTGILSGIERHVRECLPFGVAAVKSHHAIDGVRSENERLRKEVARLREDWSAMNKAADRFCADWKAALARAEDAEAEVERLRAALADQKRRADEAEDEIAALRGKA